FDLSSSFRLVLLVRAGGEVALDGAALLERDAVDLDPGLADVALSQIAPARARGARQGLVAGGAPALARYLRPGLVALRQLDRLAIRAEQGRARAGRRLRALIAGQARAGARLVALAGPVGGRPGWRLGPARLLRVLAIATAARALRALALPGALDVR